MVTYVDGIFIGVLEVLVLLLGEVGSSADGDC